MGAKDKKKLNLRDHMNENMLDLSMNELTELPVKDMALLNKATHMDISVNFLSSIPNDFCNLLHIVHLDLSKNHLKWLPEEFGNLQKLRHLDLFSNQLNTIPASFSRLGSLQWLDLKNNLLDEPLLSIAGDCLDSKQCQSCAKAVRKYARVLELQQREEEQAALVRKAKQQEKEQKKKEEAEKKLKKKKLLEKEKKRKEYELRQSLSREKEQNNGSIKPLNGKSISAEPKKEPDTSTTKTSHLQKSDNNINLHSGLSLRRVLLRSFMSIFIVVLAAVYVCAYYPKSLSSDGRCHRFSAVVRTYSAQVGLHFKKAISKVFS